MADHHGGELSRLSEMTCLLNLKAIMMSDCIHVTRVVDDISGSRLDLVAW